MSYLIKNRDVALSVRDMTKTPSKIVAQTAFFVKTIDYAPKVKAAEYAGLNASDTLQFYSSLINFKLSGDSYVSPFTVPTPITADNNIISLFDMYNTWFNEGPSFDLGRYKFFLKINNCPIGPDLFEGVINDFPFKETDDHLGLFTFDIDFTGKATQSLAANNAIKGFLSDTILKPLGFNQ